jgi:TonB family protein
MIPAVQSSALASPIWQRYFETAQEALNNKDEKKASLLFQASLKESRLDNAPGAELAESLFALGVILVQDNKDEAETYLNECLKVDEQLLGNQTAPGGLVHEYLGDIAFSRKRWDEAESQYRQAVDSLETVDKDKSYSTGILSKISEVYEKQGKKLEAEALKQPSVGSAASINTDISNYVSWMKTSNTKPPEPKRYEQMKGFRLSIPVTTTQGIDKNGYRTITMSGRYPLAPINNAGTSANKTMLVAPKMAEVDWKSYVEDLRSRITRAWLPSDRDEPVHIIVTFQIPSNGEIDDLKIVKSSNDIDSDKKAMNAINNAAPFRKLPDGASSPTKWEASFDKDELKVGVSLRRFDSTTSAGGLSYPAIFNPVAQADVDFGPYMADLQRRVKRAWFPPKGRESDRVVIVFRVDRDDNPHDTHIKSSSGVAECDEAALRAVDSA